MHCPFCNSHDTAVKDSREIESGSAIKRRRICLSCEERFTTIERSYLKELFVIKKSGVRKPFDAEKVASSIKMAIRKRNISQNQIEKITQSIIRSVENAPSREMSTRHIGEKIMLALSEIDQVAYIRFASVYHEFNSAEDFLKFVK